jgi:N-acetylmuramoyl-L-alanine amidase
MNFHRPLLLPVLSAALLLPACKPHPAHLGPLAPAPDWSQLDAFQDTVTRSEFLRLLDGVYAPGKAAAGLIEVDEKSARIRTATGRDKWFTLRFTPGHSPAKAPPRFWRSPAELRAKAPASPALPLAGWRIAIDPGHLGGQWAQMEARWFRIGDSLPVTEGDMTLRVARILSAKLRALGAEAVLLRDSDTPATTLRPEKLAGIAARELKKNGGTPGDLEVKFESERLFYRTAEIRARAALVNEKIRPDLVIALHFNADPWGDPANPSLTPNNHLHLIVNGCYSADELANDDVRLDMLVKLLGRIHDPELAASEAVAKSMARVTGLPAFIYPGGNAIPAGATGYVWARNLLANRLYRCPVIYLEPYVMNSRDVFDRVQAGDYDGEKLVAGKMRPSIYREYAGAVAEGLDKLARHGSQARQP